MKFEIGQIVQHVTSQGCWIDRKMAIMERGKIESLSGAYSIIYLVSYLDSHGHTQRAFLYENELAEVKPDSE